MPGPPRRPFPFEPTSLIGRDEELAALEGRLREPTVRLLTLTGPPGVGKTRLALAAADRLLPAFPDGVVVVPLEPMRDPEAVPGAIAGALGLRESREVAPGDLVVAALGAGERLLVLDTFEHLMPAGPWLAKLLGACAGLTLLVTSRAPLRLRGEEEFAVPALSQQASVRLFLENARAGVEDDTAVAAICRRLDGLPLAIELAAARTRLLTPAAILERLDDRFALLNDGPRDLPARHRALRAALDWSHDLLSPDERRLFQRMAVFAGGCTAEALEKLMADVGDFGPDRFGPIAALTEHSLIGRAEDGIGRLRMLETVRLYASEQLDAAGEREETRAWHARFYLGLAEEAGRRLTGPDQMRWLARLDADQDNVRAALDWCRQRDPALGLAIAAASWRYWRQRGALGEGRWRLEQALARAPTAPAATRAAALHGVGSIALLQGDLAAVRAPLHESVALFRELDERAGVAAVLNDFGNLALRRGDGDAARAAYEEAIALARESGEGWTLALALNNYGHLLGAFGDAAAAADACREALTLARRRGDRRTEALALHNIAVIARERGELDSAQALQEEALAAWRELGQRITIPAAINNLAVLAMRRGEVGTAARLYAESLVLTRELGDIGNAPANIGSLGMAALALGQPERAARLLGAAEALNEAAGVRLLPSATEAVRRSREEVQALLGEDAAAAAWESGSLLAEERAANEALAFAVSVPADTRAEPTGGGRTATTGASAAVRQPAPTVSLSAREREVLRHLVEGETNREMADELVLSIRTIESHIFNIYAKIGARGRAEAVAFALRHGLV